MISSIRRRGGTTFALVAIIIAGPAVAEAVSEPASGKVWTQTQTRVHAAPRAVYQRDMTADEAVDITVTLKLRNRGALEQRVRRMMTRGNAQYHRWLKAEEVLTDHAPTPDRVRAVANYLARAGFSDITVASNRMLITARGTAGAVQKVRPAGPRSSLACFVRSRVTRAREVPN